MKKTSQIIACTLGSGMIGFFANRLDTVLGSVCFTIGIVLLVVSMVSIFKFDKKD